MTILGSGEFRYRVEPQWGQLPDGWDFGDVGGVAVDAKDQVYVFNRGAHPMVVFDRDGAFLRSWGEGIFRKPHGLFMAPDQTLWCTDDGDHSVRHCTLDGEVLLTIGTPGRPAPWMGGEPFHRCTHTAMSPAGDLYVSDGYGNARIHKYDPSGRRLLSWGEPGTRPGEFNLPHNIHCDDDGWVYVADRENHRVQVFDGNGRYETQWNNLHRPSAMYMPRGKCQVCYLGECGPYLRTNRGARNMGPRISIVANDGSLLSQLGVEPAAGTGPGQFMSPHSIAADSRGDLYVGEVSVTAWPSLFPDQPIPAKLRALQKLTKMPPENPADRST
jgi:hypothetical protein